MKRFLQQLWAWLSRFFRPPKRLPEVPEDLIVLINTLGVQGQDGGYEVRERRPHCDVAYEALIQRGSGVVPALISVLTGQWEYHPVRVRVYHGAANYRDIYSYEQQPDPLLVQKLAIRLLGDLRDSRATDALIHVLRSPASQLEHRLEACQALGKIRTTESMAALEEAMQDETDKKMKEAIKTAIVTIGAREGK